MYLIYLDESGTPPKTDPDPYYALGGLVVCERHLEQIDTEIEESKKLIIYQRYIVDRYTIDTKMLPTKKKGSRFCYC